MSFLNCNYSRSNNCVLAALIISIVIGIITAFLQITAAITVTPVFLLVAAGIAVVYLGVLLAVFALGRNTERRSCLCAALNAVLLGILSTLLFAGILLAFGIVATSVITAILVGLLTASFSLTLTGSACLVRCRAACEPET